MLEQISLLIMAAASIANSPLPRQTNTPKGVLFKQINLAKGQVATSNFGHCLYKWSKLPLFAFLQEPFTSKSGRIPTLSIGANVFSFDASPRAAIVATPDLDAWLMPNYTSRDVAAVTWLTKDPLTPEIILVSVYADINKESVPCELLELARYASGGNTPLVICLDTNAHSTLWGCAADNERGRDYDDFISANNLSLLNIGSKPTFETSRAQSIIDISLVSYSIYDLVYDWNVSPNDFLSDHKCIEFTIDMNQVPQIPVKNWQKTDWDMFTTRVLSNSGAWKSPAAWDTETLDREVEKFSTELYIALDKSTPSFIPKNRLRKNVWWTPEIANSRKILKVAYRKWKASGSDTDRQLYIDARTYMKESVRAAKVKSWQTFCTDASSSRELARINRILQQSDKRRSLGLIRRPDGTMADNPKESVEILLDEHFPGSTTTGGKSNICNVSYSKNWAEYSWLSTVKISQAIRKFSPHKTPGLDRLKPVVLQHLPLQAIKRMKTIFCASMELEYVPQIWRETKAIFIPKTGKEDYAHARSWRPISLMSFMFKTLERLILWQLEDTVFKTNGMHKDQHAFRKGRSTESALSDTVDYLESEVLRRGLAIGVFLDIEGAFDNLLPTGVVKSLEKRQVPEKLVQWFHRYLLTRDVRVEHKGVEISRRLVRGTPQGGVLSPVLWNLAFDEILELLEGSPIKACADDLALIGRGPDMTTVQNNMQQALDKVSRWGKDQGLRFSASKSVAIAFTRKRKGLIPKLQLENTEMEWQTQVKYLGIVLDHQLKWGIHLQERLKKAKRLLFKYKQIVGSEFGPQPKHMRWMFTGIVRPMLSYGSLVWWQRASSPGAQKRLTQLTRLSLLTYGPVRQSTPTVGMEVLAHIHPMDLYLEGEVVKAWLRIKDIRKEIWDGIGTGKYLGHRRALSKLTNSFKLQEHIWDELPETKKWSRLYEVDTDFQKGEPTYSTIKCFTDGSKLNDNAGAGLCVMIGNRIVEKVSFPLGKYATVFQAEMLAIHKAT